MLSILKTSGKLVGANQVQKAVKAGKVKTVFIALDAEKRLTDPVRSLCGQFNAEIVDVDTMKELGEACGIAVGASVAAAV